MNIISYKNKLRKKKNERISNKWTLIEMQIYCTSQYSNWQTKPECHLYIHLAENYSKKKKKTPIYRREKIWSIWKFILIPRRCVYERNKFLSKRKYTVNAINQ